RGPTATLSSAVRFPNRLKRWNTMPMRWRLRASSRGVSRTALPSTKAVPIGTPSTRTDPPSGASRWLMHRSSVVFPEPLGPMTMTIPPLATDRLTPSTAVKAPNRLTRPWTDRTVLTDRPASDSPQHARLDELGDLGHHGDDRQVHEGQGEVD